MSFTCDVEFINVSVIFRLTNKQSKRRLYNKFFLEIDNLPIKTLAWFL